MQLFILAAALGFVSSLPLGPINLFVADAVLKRSQVIKFVTGVVVADTAIACIITNFNVTELVTSEISTMVWMASTIVMLVISTAMLLSLRNYSAAPSTASKLAQQSANSFSVGFLLCITNPGFWLYWLAATTMLSNSFGYTFSYLATAILVSGVAFGDFLWFTLVIKALKHSANRMKHTWLFNIRLVAALLLIAFAGISFVQSILQLL